jgi:hypothetical protein
MTNTPPFYSISDDDPKSVPRPWLGFIKKTGYLPFCLIVNIFRELSISGINYSLRFSTGILDAIKARFIESACWSKIRTVGVTSLCLKHYFINSFLKSLKDDVRIVWEHLASFVFVSLLFIFITYPLRPLIKNRLWKSWNSEPENAMTSLIP